MSQIHVLADAGAPQLSAILAGVYGQYQAETNRFKVASEFYPISPLFGYFDRAGVPVTPDSVFQLEAPDGKEALMRAQLMLNLAQRWGGMYGSLLSSAGGLASTLAQVDAEMVSNGVRTHMLTSGWRAL